SLVWFRDNDLRVRDHLPLATAASAGEVLPVYVLLPALVASGQARQTPHRTQFLLDALAGLSERLLHLGSRLLIVQGSADATRGTTRTSCSSPSAPSGATFPGGRTRQVGRPGWRAPPAIPWWMRRHGSSCPRASSTTAPAWSRRASWPSTCSSTSGRAKPTTCAS